MNKDSAYERPANATGGWRLVGLGLGLALAAAALFMSWPAPMSSQPKSKP